MPPHPHAPAPARLSIQKTPAHSASRALSNSLLLLFEKLWQDAPKRNCPWPAPSSKSDLVPDEPEPPKTKTAHVAKCEPLLSKMVASKSFSPSSRCSKLEQPEAHFNRYRRPHRFPVRSRSRLAAPCPHGLDRLFIQSQARALHHAHIRYAVVGFNNHFHDHDALILRLPRLFRVWRVRLVVARRDSYAIHAGAERTATSPAAFARTKPASGSASNTRSISMSERIGNTVRVRIAKRRQIRAGHFQIRGSKQGRIHRQLRVRIDRLHLRRRKLRHLKLRQLALVDRRQRVVVRASASARLVCASRQFRYVIGNVNRGNVRVFSNCLCRLRNLQEEGNQDQRKHARVNANRSNLGPAEVLVLRPDLSHFDGLDVKRQRCLLRGKEEVLNPITESTKARVPSPCELPSCRAFRHGPGFEKLTEVCPESATVLLRHQRRTVISSNPDGPLKQKLPNVGPEIVGHQDLRSPEFRHGSCRYRGSGIRIRCALWQGPVWNQL